MSRSVLDVRGCAAAALMACCLTATASAQQAPVPSSPAGSTQTRPQASSDQDGPQASGGREASLGPHDTETAEQSALPVSVDRVREGLAREPVLRLDTLPVFSLTVNERRPRYWDLEAPYRFEVEPRTSTTRWHDEYLAMTTPSEARAYGAMLSASETATIAATSLLFSGAASLVKTGFGEWKRSRREGAARDAAAEVDAALAAWQAARVK